MSNLPILVSLPIDTPLVNLLAEPIQLENLWGDQGLVGETSLQLQSLDSQEDDYELMNLGSGDILGIDISQTLSSQGMANLKAALQSNQWGLPF